MNRNVVIAGSVVLLHVAALWALQTGLLQRTTEVIVPAELLSEFIPAPTTSETRPAPPLRAAKPQAVRPSPTPAAQSRPQTTAAPAPVPTPARPQAEPAPAAPTVTAATPAPATAAAPSAAPEISTPAKVELPSSSADYLNNPKPAYPAMSKRLGEQGKVVVRVLIGADGSAQKAEIKTSSGFDRLDQAAIATVLKWRYVPGKRAGVAEAMWFNVPINFVLE